MIHLFVLFSGCVCCYPALLCFLTSIFTVCSCHPPLLCCHLVLLCASVIQLPCFLLSSNFTVMSSSFSVCRCHPTLSFAVVIQLYCFLLSYNFTVCCCHPTLLCCCHPALVHVAGVSPLLPLLTSVGVEVRLLSLCLAIMAPYLLMSITYPFLCSCHVFEGSPGCCRTLVDSFRAV